MRRYLELFFRHWIRFSLPLVVAMGAGVAYGLKAPPSYSSAATLFCDASLPNASTFQQGVPPGGVTPCQDKSSILQEFLHTQSFVNKVALRATHLKQIDNLTADSIVKGITVTVNGPQIMTISVKAATPALASGTAQAVIDEFTDELRAVLEQRGSSQSTVYKALLDSTAATLATARAALDAYFQAHPGVSTTDPQVTQLENEVTVAQQQHQAAQDHYNSAQLGGPTAAVDPTAFHVIDPPGTPTAPASGKKKLLLAGIGGMLGGAVVTILALVLLMARDRTVREARDLEPQLEVLGSVPQFGKGVLSPRRWRRREKPQEGFVVPPDLLRPCKSALRHLKLEERTGVTSCVRGEGRSSIAAGIAAAAHEAYGFTVILVELDFEHPSLAHQFGFEASPGVAEILRDGVELRDCLHMPEGSSVGVVVAGDTKDDPAGLFTRLRASSLVQDLGGLCDVVIADLPPISSDGQLAWIGEQFNSVLLVVHTGTVEVGEIRRSVDDLDKPPPVILNGVESSIPRPLRALLAR